jgi:hypothetical protein
VGHTVVTIETGRACQKATNGMMFTEATAPEGVVAGRGCNPMTDTPDLPARSRQRSAHLAREWLGSDPPEWFARVLVTADQVNALRVFAAVADSRADEDELGLMDLAGAQREMAERHVRTGRRWAEAVRKLAHELAMERDKSDGR